MALGHPDLDLRAVTTGAGHLAGDRTARNAAITLAIGGRRDIAVAAGAAGPLVRERMIAKVLDMETALDPERPDLDAVDLDSRHSVELIMDSVRDGATTIVTTGPLTNLALALKRYDDLAGRIERIVTLGGSWGLGNKTAAAEWNILCDPEAASIVFNAGVPITLIPIDAAVGASISDTLIGRVQDIGGPVGAFAAELLQSLVKTFRPSVLGPEIMPLNDPVASIVAAVPGVGRTVKARLDVELDGRHSYGRTVIDFAGRSHLAPNVDVVVSLNENDVHDLLVASIASVATSRP
jgi:inosine-uridine nucleoside N-ribohydrolase